MSRMASSTGSSGRRNRCAPLAFEQLPHDCHGSPRPPAYASAARSTSASVRFVAEKARGVQIAAPATPDFKASRRPSKRKAPEVFRPQGLFCLEPGSDLLWHARKSTLPSARSVFTSEFGMGSGGSRSLLPPGKLFRSRMRLKPDLRTAIRSPSSQRVQCCNDAFSVSTLVAFTSM